MEEIEVGDDAVVGVVLTAIYSYESPLIFSQTKIHSY